MKKLLSFVLALAVLFTVAPLNGFVGLEWPEIDWAGWFRPVVHAAEKDAGTKKMGDVDGNGEVESGDARLVLRASVGLEKFTDAQKTLADVDFDGEISSGDARLVLRASVGLEKLESPQTELSYSELIKDVDVEEVYEEKPEDISFDEESGCTFINNVVVIDFDWECSNQRKADIINSLNGTVVGGIEGYNELHIQVKKSSLSELKSICDELNKNGDIYTSIDYYMATDDAMPVNDPWSDNISESKPYENWDDPFMPPNNNWNMVAVEAPAAWGYKEYFGNIPIGVVDDGFSANHPDLDLEIISKEKSAADHGTHVAGIIGATADNGKGITGLVWNKRLLAYDAKKENQEKYKDCEIYKGIEQLVKKGCKVINLSIGKSGDLINSRRDYAADWVKREGETASKRMGQLLERPLFDSKYKYDFVIVQAAGNGASDHKGVDAINNGLFCSVTKDNCYSSRRIGQAEILNRIIVVANARRDFINKGYVCRIDSNGNTNDVDIAAPGDDIFSTVFNNNSNGVPYGTEGGTSMAAPVVAGIASLVWSVNKNLKGSEVRGIVLSSAWRNDVYVLDDPTSPTTGDFPMANAKLAVEEAIKETYSTCTAKGIVEELNGAKLKGVEVKATNKDNKKSVYTQTDENGAFSMLLPVGEYKFTITCPGYDDLTIETTETKKSNKTHKLGEFKMKRTVNYGTVTGRIIDKNNNVKLDGAEITFYDIISRQEYQTVSNDSGEFSITVPFGEYYVETIKKDFEHYGMLQSVNMPESYLFDNIAILKEGNNEGVFIYGSGTELDPYQVSTPAQLDAVRNDLDACYIQTADIDMKEFGNWDPIGNSSNGIGGESIAIALELPENNPFTGKYNGTIFSISNLQISSKRQDPYQDNYGMFALIENAVVENIHIEKILIDVNRSGVDYAEICQKNGWSGVVLFAGALAGESRDTTIKRCTADGAIKINQCLNADVGGLIGMNYAPKQYVNRLCTTNVNIIVNAVRSSFAKNPKQDEIDSFVSCGGINGWCWGDVDGCANSGSISVTAGTCYIGGIDGESTSCNVTNCVNQGSLNGVALTSNAIYVNVTPLVVGGILGLFHGDNETPIQYCVNYGNISASCRADSTATIGGIGGDSMNAQHCYNINKKIIFSSNGIGACFYSPIVPTMIAVGDNYTLDSTTTFCDGKTSGRAGMFIKSENTPPSFDDYSAMCGGKTLTAEELLLPETYSSFDFDSLWRIDPEIGGAVLKELNEIDDTDINI